MENSALRARYDAFDRDADGRIDLGEFASLLDALGLGYEQAQVRAAFEAIDGDQNGQLDFAEFSEWWSGR
ncbi:MAG TPA: EF-hand domain-containing protein [Polyangiaceae bacterium]